MITVDSLIRIPLTALSNKAAEAICAALTYPNPEYISGKKRGVANPRKKVDGRWVSIPRTIESWRRQGDSLLVPRGAIGLVKRHLVPWPGHNDRRLVLPEVRIPAGSIGLRPYQVAARDAITKCLQGVVVIPAGGGKTFTALAAVAEIRQPTLVIVHTLDLLDQWQDEIEEQFGFEAGTIQGKKLNLQPITVATVQTLLKQDLDHLSQQFGCIILDEGHHAPASTFDQVLHRFPAKYRIALTATPDRADGLTEKLFHTFGPVLHETDQRFLLDEGHLVPARIHEVHTGFTFPYGGAGDWQAMSDAIAKDDARNTQILNLLAELYQDEGRVILVLSGRVEEHLVPLHEAARARGILGELLVGKVKKDTRRLIRKGVRAGSIRVLFASTVADEGLNIPELNTLLLTFPAKSESRVEQRVGRVMRPAPGKTHGDVYDFIDSSVLNVVSDSKPLQRQYTQRKKAYKKLRAEIVTAGSPARRKQVVIHESLPILQPPAFLKPGKTGFIVGMDPSFTHYGLVAVDLADWWPGGMTTIETAKSDRKLGLRVADDDTRRLELLLAGIRDFLATYPPLLICCETPSSGAQSADALKGLSYAKALAVASKVFRDVPTAWLLPGEIKERVGGSLTTSKADVADMVRAVKSASGRRWIEANWDPLKGKSEHQFDAAASILAAQATDLFQMALR